MSEFDDLPNVDVDKLLRLAEEYERRAEEAQERAAELRGEAASEGGRVRVTTTVADGVSDIHIDPRAMRMSADELAGLLKTLIRDANADLHEKMRDVFTEMYGEENNPLNIRDKGDAMKKQVEDAAAVFNRTMDDAVGEFERIRKRLES